MALEKYNTSGTELFVDSASLTTYENVKIVGTSYPEYIKSFNENFIYLTEELKKLINGGVDKIEFDLDKYVSEEDTKRTNEFDIWKKELINKLDSLVVEQLKTTNETIQGEIKNREESIETLQANFNNFQNTLDTTVESLKDSVNSSIKSTLDTTLNSYVETITNLSTELEKTSKEFDTKLNEFKTLKTDITRDNTNFKENVLSELEKFNQNTETSISENLKIFTDATTKFNNELNIKVENYKNLVEEIDKKVNDNIIDKVQLNEDIKILVSNGISDSLITQDKKIKDLSDSLTNYKTDTTSSIDESIKSIEENVTNVKNTVEGIKTSYEKADNTINLKIKEIEDLITKTDKSITDLNVGEIKENIEAHDLSFIESKNLEDCKQFAMNNYIHEKFQHYNEAIQTLFDYVKELQSKTPEGVQDLPQNFDSMLKLNSDLTKPFEMIHIINPNLLLNDEDEKLFLFNFSFNSNGSGGFVPNKIKVELLTAIDTLIGTAYEFDLIETEVDSPSQKGEQFDESMNRKIYVYSKLGYSDLIKVDIKNEDSMRLNSSINNKIKITIINDSNEAYVQTQIKNLLNIEENGLPVSSIIDKKILQ